MDRVEIAMWRGIVIGVSLGVFLFGCSSQEVDERSYLLGCEETLWLVGQSNDKQAIGQVCEKVLEELKGEESE